MFIAIGRYHSCPKQNKALDHPKVQGTGESPNPPNPDRRRPNVKASCSMFSKIRLKIQASAMPCSEIQSTHHTTERDTMDEQQQNTEEMIDGLVRSERMAHAIGQTPKYIKDEIASLVEGEQIPGSFGDLIKRSFEMAAAHREFAGTNVVSLFGKSSAR